MTFVYSRSQLVNVEQYVVSIRIIVTPEIRSLKLEIWILGFGNMNMRIWCVLRCRSSIVRITKLFYKMQS